MTEQQFESINRWILLGDLRAAADEVRELLVQDAQDASLWELEARTRAAMKEFDTAAYAVEQAVLLAPKSVSSLLLQAWFARMMGNLDEARDWENEALDQAETQEEEFAIALSEARTLLASAELEIRELVEEMAEEEVPEVMQVPDEIIEIFQDGIEALNDVLEVDPQHAEALALQAEFFSALNQPEKAVELRGEALEYSPDNLKWLHDQADEYERLEEGEQAMELYRRLFELEKQAIQEAKNPHGLFFEAEEFATLCSEAWAELEGYIREEGVSLNFSVITEPMVSETLLEDTIPEEPIDPWTAFHLTIEPGTAGRDLIKIILFQRNVERFWREAGDVTIKDLLMDILDDAAAPAILLADGNGLFDTGEEG
ncbi:MAG: hypothetical protein H6727_16250 [Myxococcales bacterium]|nr:hypothetical protein [Myxococcales bacterium]